MNGPWNEGAMDREPVYTVETRENGRRLSLTDCVDPFVNHTIHVRGWRNALRVLLRRYSATVIVSADREVVEQIVTAIRAKNYGLRTLVHEVVQSRLFLDK